MTKTLRILSLALVVLMGALAYGQTALTQTTLAAAVPIGPASLAGGAQGALATTVNLTSAMGVTQAFNGQPVTYLYIDQELMAVQTLLQGQTTIFNVLRAQGGTKAGYHRSGAMVLIGIMTPQFGGVSGSGGFQQTDPPLNSVCTASNTGLTPWVNVITGEQWLCSSVTNTWVPGWNNRFVPIQQQATAAVASASTITPTGPFFHVTGTTALVTFTLPVGFERGCFTIITDGAETWTAAGNISVASAAAQGAGESVTFCYDVNTSKFYPSHL